MSDKIQIKPYETVSEGGLKVVITHLIKNPYNRFKGYYIDTEGQKIPGLWQKGGLKCNGNKTLNIDTYNPELVRIEEDAKMMWSSKNTSTDN